MNGRIIIHIFPSSSFPIFGEIGRFVVWDSMLGYTLFGIYVCCADGCIYVGFFGICGFVVSRGLITPGYFGRGVLGGFR